MAHPEEEAHPHLGILLQKLRQPRSERRRAGAGKRRDRDEAARLRAHRRRHHLGGLQLSDRDAALLVELAADRGDGGSCGILAAGLPRCAQRSARTLPSAPLAGRPALGSADGARETARVTGTKRTNYRVNNRYRYRLTWEEQSGRHGESLAYKEHHLTPYQPGQEITVYQGIKRAWWSGDVGERPGTTD